MIAPLATIRSYDDLVAAFRARKAEIGLSNNDCDTLGGLTTGHTDKLLGPTRSKKLGPFTFDVFSEMFAVEFIMVPNPDAVRRMEARWERRVEQAVRLNANRVSMQLKKRALPEIMRDLSKKAVEAQKRKIKPSTRRRIARMAAKARWQKHRRPTKLAAKRPRRVTS